MPIATSDPIFITGGTGLVGSYLLRRLHALGYSDLRALRRKNSPMDLVADIEDHVQWIEGDLLDTVILDDAMQGCKAVIHAAAMISFAPKARKQMLRINVEGTANIVNTCLNQGINRLLFVSSVAALGRTKEKETLDETAQWNRSPLNTNYAISKYLAEQEVWRGQAEGLQTAIVNPSLIVGGGFWHSGPQQLFQYVWEGNRFTGSGDSNLVDVRDVVDFLILLLEQDISNERYILSAHHLPMRALLASIAASLKKPAPGRTLPSWAGQIVWRLEALRSTLTGRAPLLTRETVQQSRLQYHYLHEKSLTVPGFTYRNWEQTIRETAAAFLASYPEGRGSGVF